MDDGAPQTGATPLVNPSSSEAVAVSVGDGRQVSRGDEDGKASGDGASRDRAEMLVEKAFEDHDRDSFNFRLGSGRWSLRFNPVVTLSSIALIWAFIVWCLSKPDEANEDLKEAKRWITETSTWAYILSQIIWVVFLGVVYFSKYSDLKLGKPDDKPEFSSASWFMMLFASGIAVGFFYFGVGETIFHYEPCSGVNFQSFAGVDGNCQGNRFSDLGDNARAIMALNTTLFHWGIHAWVVYALVGLLLGLICYRQNLPMTMKSCFYPLIGDRIFGWMGDAIDVLSVITTLFGVCTSLGLGVRQINIGLNRYNSDIDVSTDNQVAIIWCVTLIATTSVVLGLRMGIRRFSEVTWLLGMFIVTALFFLGASWYLLNLYVQAWGWYLFSFIPLSFHTDAFAQLGETPDGRGSPESWMDDWTIFYWGWWISWAPFVGVFTAKISKGRTVKEFILGVLCLPTFYSFLWLVVFGGEGLRMERKAAAAGIMCPGTPMGPDDDPENFLGYKEIDGVKITRLSCQPIESQYFDVWDQFPAGDVYGALSIGAIILYFVTSSDSGSLVIDCITANGNPNPPVLQRVFWALTEGAAACALLVAGGQESLSALQTAAIVAGLPYTVVLCFFCVALWDVLKQEYGDFNYNRAVFSSHLVDVFSTQGFTMERLIRTLIAVVCPMVGLGKAGASLHTSKAAKQAEYLAIGFFFYLWIVLMVLIPVVDFNIWAIAWCSYMAFAGLSTRVRINARAMRGIEGDMLTDFLASLVLYPLVAAQLDEDVDVNGPLLSRKAK
ncbi:unnamed protein product [Ostreobium quekettii]|uniref:Uncharacterized protein n=1 Tax=Ostreobium quekettii TaxID=121088 RepID=A0A8S1ILX2_9CHLO|nr:unnamed protein product [Ostreobium quekettii]|eukprot:evm.model.scf_11.30 EVM.evm.TU.scf_11.30   scf_11:265311-274906(+)